MSEPKSKPKKSTVTKKTGKMPAAKVEVAVEEITLDQFRFWLEGVEEMQSDDWVPNSTQWHRIRAKIDSIIIEEIETVVVNNVGAPPARPVYAQPAPIPSSTLMPPPPTNMGVPPGQSLSEGRVKTPDVDTSDGEYNSMFT